MWRMRRRLSEASSGGTCSRAHGAGGGRLSGGASSAARQRRGGAWRCACSPSAARAPPSRHGARLREVAVGQLQALEAGEARQRGGLVALHIVKSVLGQVQRAQLPEQGGAARSTRRRGPLVTRRRRRRRHPAPPKARPAFQRRRHRPRQQQAPAAAARPARTLVRRAMASGTLLRQQCSRLRCVTPGGRHAGDSISSSTAAAAAVASRGGQARGPLGRRGRSRRQHSEFT